MHRYDFLWVFLGGGLGSVLRYLLSYFCLTRFPAFPWGTLLVNLLGSMAAGALLGRFPAAGYPAWKLFLLTGLLGGFTTFSAFSLETLNLWVSQQRIPALYNLLLNLGGGLLAVCLGYWLVKAINA